MTWIPNQRDRIMKDRVEYCIEDQDFDECIELDGGKLLVQMASDIGIEFAVLEECSSQASDGSPDTYEMVFRGHGFTGGLRECRHTWWGESDNAGYIYYPNFELIESAFKVLRKWFD